MLHKNHLRSAMRDYDRKLQAQEGFFRGKCGTPWEGRIGDWGMPLQLKSHGLKVRH